jgi:hypothetical protein
MFANETVKQSRAKTSAGYPTDGEHMLDKIGTLILHAAEK